MKDALKRAVDMLFHGMPFSRRNNEFKEKVLEAAVQKYDADRADGITEADFFEVSYCGSTRRPMTCMKAAAMR